MPISPMSFEDEVALGKSRLCQNCRWCLRDGSSPLYWLCISPDIRPTRLLRQHLISDEPVTPVCADARGDLFTCGTTGFHWEQAEVQDDHY